LTDIRRVATQIAAAVSIEAQKDGLTPKLEEELRQRVTPAQWTPDSESNIVVCGDLAAVTENGRRIPAVAQPAMQMGAHAAKMIAADLRGKPRTPFHYFDKGDMATIGRGAAVAKVVWPFRADWSGFIAWISWLLVHFAFLSGADRQMSVLFTWIYSYATKTARSRLVIASRAAPTP
jgi:NADH dehydrogenase